MINKTLLYRDSVTTTPSFSARWRAETFSATSFRSHGKHGEIERNFTNVTTSLFPRTIHKRNLRSRLRKAFYERGTFEIYERDYVVSLTFVTRTWFTNATTEGVSIEALCSWFTFVTTYSVELNIGYPFNLHERGLGTEHGTNVEQAVTTGCSQGTVLFYHLFGALMVVGWIGFRISPWESLTEKSYVVTAWKTRTWHVRGKSYVVTAWYFMFSFSMDGVILQMPYVVTNVG